MGQRTAVIVKKIDRYGKTSLRIVHNQWGFGKVMPMLFMKEFIGCMYNEYKNKYSNKLEYFFNFTNNGNNLYSCRGLKSNDNIFDKKFLKKVYKKLDNNNGAMLVEIIEEPLEENYKYDRGYVKLKDVKISFVLGCEECDIWDEENKQYLELEKPFERLVSAKEYMIKTSNNSYGVPQFIPMFEQFIDMWGITEVVDNTENEELSIIPKDTLIEIC